MSGATLIRGVIAKYVLLRQVCGYLDKRLVQIIRPARLHTPSLRLRRELLHAAFGGELAQVRVFA